MADKMPKYTVY